MAAWSSLAPDIVRHVADLVLAENDVDHYMDMRSVCHNWRLAMADPCRRRGDVVDDLCRFRPRHWVMLDEEPDDDDENGVRLFLNVSTGRFIRMHVPMLRDHVLVAASDGLLVLADVMYPHAARVLNPFTGWYLRFAAAIPRVNRVRAAVAGSEDDPSLVFSFYHNPYDNAVSCARRTDCELSRLVPVDSTRAARPLLFSRQASMAVHRGHVYIADPEGLIVKLESLQQQRYCRVEPVANLSSSDEIERRLGRAFLLVSTGELLLVCHLRRPRAVAVFRVDVERKVLEPLTGIGSRALFLGDRCLSVDAGELPSVDGNCVYMVTASVEGVWKYDLSDGRETMISGFRDRPLGMVQVLLTYCVILPDAKAQLHSIYRTS